MVDYTFIKEQAPCYIYDEGEIISQCNKLKKALSAFEFLYSIKANPFDKIIQSIAKEGFGADAASANEVIISLENGMKGEKIFYSAPGKTDEEIAGCYGKCVIIADSFFDIERINAEASRRSEIAKIGVRINPNFSMEGGAGVSSKFGIDIEQADELSALLQRCPNVCIAGIHIHIKSQILDFEILGNYYRKCFQLAKRMSLLEQVEIEFINFGSGIGALYDVVREQPVDLEKLSNMVDGMVEENRQSLRAKLYIETGRFVVCNAGTYCTRIVDIKVSHGRKYLIVQNGINGFLRPAMTNMLHNVAGGEPIAAQEPFYTSEYAFSMRVLNDETEKECVTVAGNLCTALDVLAENIQLNTAKTGDIIAISNAGSYAYSLSPLLFASHPPPKQLYAYASRS